MMKKYLLSFAVAFFLLTACAPRRAQAQFIGFTSPQTVRQSFTVADCTLGGSLFTVANLGQTAHQANYTLGGGNLPTQFSVSLTGGPNTGSQARISDVATNTLGFITTAGQVAAVGYYPVVQISVPLCTGTSPVPVTLNYSGTSALTPLPFGIFDQATYKKEVFMDVPGNVSITRGAFATPYGSSGGFIVLRYATVAVAGSTFQVNMGDDLTVGTAITGPFPIANVLGTAQIFYIPHIPQAALSIVYTSGGGAAGPLLEMVYYFFRPGQSGSAVGPASTASQASGLFNGVSTGAGNTAVSRTVTGVIGQRARVERIDASCSAGTATLIVQDGATTIWQLAPGTVGTTTTTVSWSPPLSATTGATLTITLGACGAGNTGTLVAQADQQ